MRLVSHLVRGAARPGVLVPAPDGDRVLDLGPALPGRSVLDVLADPAVRAAAQAALDAARPADLLDRAAVRLLPPVHPGTVYAVGHNYVGHLGRDADPAQRPAHPNVFVKTPNTLGGPDDPVVLPPAAHEVDYEGEIAVVLARRAHRVPLDEAEACIGGLTLYDDVSARDWQRRTSQWALGKCADGFGPLGPAVVTTDEALPLAGRELTVERDGVVTARASTDDMVFSPAFLVHHLSQLLTLEPGDVIATGTPAKLPEAADAHRPLRHGDTVTVRVTGLGALTTTFVDPPASPGARTADEPTPTRTTTGGLP
ncbi:fumarylacetoacetate hydrolase family protein [Cellulomonas triticagri]|uniref:FAA hydrolase family protein n=1 Tax=Cellulomonas triticagri TaxID=2483352 RepID=A0A3M2JDI3_9CELL|nr:fumarylacetoacetate hydrolase family protein [Cellulomonas triticagri]RMI09663.1 FAA hydrolase family protein [Cellulomonas triticagri]